MDPLAELMKALDLVSQKGGPSDWINKGWNPLNCDDQRGRHSDLVNKWKM